MCRLRSLLFGTPHLLRHEENDGAISAIGTLGGYFGPRIFGQLRDWSGTDFAGLIFLSSCAIVGIVIVLVLGHNPLLERPVQTAPAAAI